MASAGTLFRTYLRDHLAGAVIGVELARRCRDNNQGTELASFLDDVIEQILADRRTLTTIMDHLGVKPSPLKVTLAFVGERVGRLVPNGQLIGYSPLSRVVELEALTAGVETKRKLWLAIKAALPARRLPDDVDLDQLIERAQGQHDGLEEQRQRAAREAFGPAFASA